MGSQSCIHCCTNNTEIILLIYHKLSEGLHGSLLLACLRINDVSRLVLWLTIFCFRWVNWRVCRILFLSETEINQVDKMSLVCLIANSDIGWFQISMNIALLMNRIQPIHQLQSNNNDSLNREFTFFERFFKLF